MGAMTELVATPLQPAALSASVLPTMVDAQVDALADVFGWSLRSAQTATAAALAILLKLGEMMCFGVAAALWPMARSTNDAHGAFPTATNQVAIILQPAPTTRSELKLLSKVAPQLAREEQLRLEFA